MQVFISYPKGDERLAADLTTGLREAGVPVWSAAESIYPGDNWPLEVGKALEESDVLVAVFRRGADNSPVTRDALYALTSGKYRNVIPVLTGYATFQAGVDVPWILLRLDPVYDVDDRRPDIAQIVKRVQEVADTGSHASA